jgi:hypothetical protein
MCFTYLHIYMYIYTYTNTDMICKYASVYMNIYVLCTHQTSITGRWTRAFRPWMTQPNGSVNPCFIGQIARVHEFMEAWDFWTTHVLPVFSLSKLLLVFGSIRLFCALQRSQFPWSQVNHANLAGTSRVHMRSKYPMLFDNLWCSTPEKWWVSSSLRQITREYIKYHDIYVIII